MNPAPLLHHQQCVVALKGSKRVHLIAQEHAENATVAICVNALSNTVPPVILFKGIRRKPTFQDNLPPGSAVFMSPNGSMTTELFCKWLEHFETVEQFKPNGKVLLIFDGVTSHLDITIITNKTEELDILLISLPNNATH